MITSVFLSNNTVFVACGLEGKQLPKQAESMIFRMAEGCLLNGMITNEQELTEQLGEFWKAKRLPEKNVRLILESSHFSVKSLTVPKMKPGEVKGIVAREFSDMEQYEEKLYDYAGLQETKEGGFEALAVMVNRSYIEGWQQIFQNIGVTLERITVSREAMTRYFASCDILRQGACVLLLLDDMVLTSVLWIDGRLVSADRKRMFSEAGSEDFYTEVSRSVSSIRQFYESQKEKRKLTKLYLCGFQESDVARCQESVDNFGLNMQVQRLQEPYADNVMAAGGLIWAKKPLNMLQALKAKEKSDKSIGFSWKKALPPLILLGACIVAAIGLMAACSVRMNRASALSEYLTDPGNLSRKLEAEMLDRDIARMTKVVEQAKQVREIKRSYPLVDSQVTDRIRAAAGYDIDVRIDGYDGESGELRLEINTPVVDRVNQYVSALQDTGMFVEVGYTGYVYLEGEGNYQVQISCILRGDAGK